MRRLWGENPEGKMIPVLESGDRIPLTNGQALLNNRPNYVKMWKFTKDTLV